MDLFQVRKNIAVGFSQTVIGLKPIEHLHLFIPWLNTRAIEK
jgi:hypothetical protein